MNRRAPGFSLIEMAFVLIIVTLLLGGLLVPFATQVEQKRMAETNKAMEEIKEALMGYALSHGAGSQPYLPCPDINNDGGEDRDIATGVCDLQEGSLPWATLGVGSQDAWGNRYRYRVTKIFSDRVPGFNLTDPGTLTVCSNAPTVASPNVCPVIARSVPAVVLSGGKNGFGAIGVNTGIANPAPASTDEAENTTTGLNIDIFVSRIFTGPGAPAGEFDDQVVWISPNVLFYRMVAAGRLP